MARIGAHEAGGHLRGVGQPLVQLGLGVGGDRGGERLVGRRASGACLGVQHAVGEARLPGAVGEVELQIVRTVPEHMCEAVPKGDFRILESYGRALRSAERLIYLENQFLWAPEIGAILAEKLRHPPSDDFRLLVRGRLRGDLELGFGVELASHGGGPTNLHMLLAMPNAIYMETGSLKGESSSVEKLRMVEGSVLAPETPGMGSEVRAEYIAKHKV